MRKGKAILVVRDGDILIENIEFAAPACPTAMAQASASRGASSHVRGCAFFDNQNGLLTANFDDAELSIEDSEFAQAPPVEGKLHHLLYVGRIASLKVSGSRFHQGHIGHLLKSRARRTELAYDMLVDGAGGRASYEVDLPNGGDALLHRQRHRPEHADARTPWWSPTVPKAKPGRRAGCTWRTTP